MTLLAQAEEIKTNPLSEATIYTKVKFNLVNRWQTETGLSHTTASIGRWSLGSNIGYTQTYPSLMKDTGWNFGISLSYKVDSRYSVYGKASTSFLGAWRGEYGIRATLAKGRGYSLAANVGYAHAIPFRSSLKPQWISALTVSVPMRSLVKW